MQMRNCYKLETTDYSGELRVSRKIWNSSVMLCSLESESEDVRFSSCRTSRAPPLWGRSNNVRIHGPFLTPEGIKLAVKR